MYIREIAEHMPTPGAEVTFPAVDEDALAGRGEHLSTLMAYAHSRTPIVRVVYASELGYGTMDPAAPAARTVFLTDRRGTCAALRNGLDACSALDRDDRFGIGAYWDLRPVLHSAEDGTWFGLDDRVLQPNPSPSYGTGIVYHIMKLAPGCHYYSVAQSIEDGFGRPESR